MQTHYFIALSLPNEIKEQLAQYYSLVTKHFPFHKRVHTLDYHITLTFLGFYEEAMLLQLMEEIANDTDNFEAFPLTIDGYDTFGNTSVPRIFWNRLQYEQALFDLQQIVAERCVTYGIQLDKRPYNPHITVARKWAGEVQFDADLLEQYNPLQNMPLTFNANEIVLYRTNITATPKYEPIISIPLKNYEPFI